jgi:hypothetical protein
MPVGDSKVDTSSEGHEVAPQQDCDQESRYLAGQLRVSEDIIMAATRHIDDTCIGGRLLLEGINGT